MNTAQRPVAEQQDTEQNGEHLIQGNLAGLEVLRDAIETVLEKER